jgi:hypothetical protein
MNSSLSSFKTYVEVATNECNSCIVGVDLLIPYLTAFALDFFIDSIKEGKYLSRLIVKEFTGLGQHGILLL